MIRIDFKKDVVVQSVDAAEIIFSDGTKLSYYHDQDCCESVYADFKAIEDQPIMKKSFKHLEIEGVEDFGIKLNIVEDKSWGPRISNPVPCYNVQNGYYSGNLELIIIIGETSLSYDISKYVKDDIC